MPRSNYKSSSRRERMEMGIKKKLFNFNTQNMKKKIFFSFGSVNSKSMKFEHTNKMWKKNERDKNDLFQHAHPHTH